MPGDTRPNAHLPPLQIELHDFIDGMLEDDSQFPQFFAAVEGYQQQAINMTEEEQLEYQEFLSSKSYYIHQSAINKPSNHRVYKYSRSQPTWAKYVLLTSIFGDCFSIRQLFSSLGNLHLDDYTAEYRQLRPLAISKLPPNAFTSANNLPAAASTPTPPPNAFTSMNNLPAAVLTEMHTHAPPAGLPRALSTEPPPRPPLLLSEECFKGYVDRSQEQTCTHNDRRFDDLNKRLDDSNKRSDKRFDDLDKRFVAQDTHNVIFDGRLDSLNDTASRQYEAIHDIRKHTYLNHYMFVDGYKAFIYLRETGKQEQERMIPRVVKDSSTQTELPQNSKSTQTGPVESKTKDSSAQTE